MKCKFENIMEFTKEHSKSIIIVSCCQSSYKVRNKTFCDAICKCKLQNIFPDQSLFQLINALPAQIIIPSA